MSDSETQILYRSVLSRMVLPWTVANGKVGVFVISSSFLRDSFCYDYCLRLEGIFIVSTSSFLMIWALKVAIKTSIVASQIYLDSFLRLSSNMKRKSIFGALV